MSWGNVAIAGATLVGGYLSSRAQQKAAGSASSSAYSNTAAQIAAQQKSEQRAYDYMQPYNQAGLGALGTLQQPATTWGVDIPLYGQRGTWTYQDIVNANQAKGATTAPSEQLMRDFQNAGYNVQTGMQNPNYVDPTGGANQYIQMLQGLRSPNFPQVGGMLPELNTQQFAYGGTLPGLNVPQFASPNAPLPDLNIPEFAYSFDPNDPGYQFKLQESQKAIDAATAARGNYNSRAAINAISDAQRAITADEASSQFQRAKDIYGLNAQTALSNYGADYAKATDLFQRAQDIYGMNAQAMLSNYGADYARQSDLYQRAKDIYGINAQTDLSRYGADYTKAMDIYKSMYGRQQDLYNMDYGRISDLYNMSTQAGNTEYQKLLDLVKIGQGSAASAGNAALATGQGVASSYGALSKAQQDAAYSRGETQGDFWSGLGPAAMNAYSLYQLGNTNTLGGSGPYTADYNLRDPYNYNFRGYNSDAGNIYGINLP